MLDVKLGLKPVAGIREFDQLVQPVLLLLQRTARPGFEKASGDLAKIGDRARLRGFLQRRPFASVLQGLSPEIGSASFRERVCWYVSFSGVAGPLKKKKKEL